MSTTVISRIVHRLHRVLLDAAGGQFPPVDGGVDVAVPMAGGHHAVVEFTGHSFVLTDRDRDDVLARGADGFGGASHPDLLRWLAGPDGWIGSHDAVLAARGTGGGRLVERDDLDDHPRVVRSRHHRRDVDVYGDETGVVTIGRGLVDRLEVSVEVFPAGMAGDGRRLIAEALGLVPAGEVVFAQVAPGNAASLRAFLSCGFAPIGAETLLLPAKN
jgi:RimJ/RimL family protein N-acetyltransferase